MIKKKLGYSVTNEMRSNVEFYLWMHNKPKSYFLYINETTRKATTWTGQKLGGVFFGTEYRSNFGDKRQPIWVYGTNGIKYYGTYYKDSGNYARIKAMK